MHDDVRPSAPVKRLRQVIKIQSYEYFQTVAGANIYLINLNTRFVLSQHAK